MLVVSIMEYIVPLKDLRKSNLKAFLSIKGHKHLVTQKELHIEKKVSVKVEIAQGTR